MLFIDTGAFLARYLANDQHHLQATKLWDKIRRENHRLFTSNFVLDETFTLLGRWAGFPFAADRARNIYQSDILAILRPDRDDELKALVFFEKYADQKVSFTDCISFTLMQRESIKHAFSFDQHFTLPGFNQWI